MRKIFSVLIIFFLLSFYAIPSHAAIYKIDDSQSEVQFSGEHAGNIFNGKFEKWSGAIDFNPEKLDTSSVKFMFDLKSTKTGNTVYDGTLPQSDWFDIKNNPQAEFVSSKFSKNADGTYKIDGTLTLRGKSNPVSFDFQVSDLNVQPVTATASIPIDRLAFDIGLKSDAKAEWVSKMITIDLKIVAQKN